MTQPRATVDVVDGEVVLNDPDAMQFINAVNRHNCLETLREQRADVERFFEKLKHQGYDPHHWMIVTINVDSMLGQEFADGLMPGHDWQKYRDEGQRPFARGVVPREGMQQVLDSLMLEAGAQLRKVESGPVRKNPDKGYITHPEHVAVMVLDHDAVEIFTVADAVPP